MDTIYSVSRENGGLTTNCRNNSGIKARFWDRETKNIPICIEITSTLDDSALRDLRTMPKLNANAGSSLL